jgi:hypothetical protein
MEKLGRHGTTGVTFKCEPEKKLYCMYTQIIPAML